MIRNQFVSCIALRAIQFLLPSIVLLTVLTDSVNAQNVLSVPFSNGFVGDNTGNNSAGNCYYTNSLGFTNLQFVQNSTGTQFVEQGNDIVGSVVFYDAAGTYRSIPGFVKWRAPSGTVTTMVFRPSSATVTNVATNGSNGAATYPISSSKYIGLTFNGNTLTIGGSGNVTGNAATNGLLQELNTYLGNLPSITIVNVSVSENGGSAVVTVTLSESSGSVVTVQYNTSDSTATAGSDYTSTSGTLTFNAGQTTKTITIPIIDDVSVESNEMFHIELYNSTNASIVDYQSLVTILDNEVAPVPGCTDSEACNYNASATQDNGTCTYPTQSYLNCAGTCINDTDNDGVCNELEVPGCTDPTACNYNASATDNNNTCTYPTQSYLNCGGTCINDSDNDGICNELEIAGCTDPTACNYNSSATDNNNTCTYPAQTYLNCAGQCINDTDNDGVCNEDEVPGCTDPEACNYNILATDDNATCTYPSQTYLNCDGSCINDADNDGICNENEVSGCTDPEACNYNILATDDDATCTYPAQTYLNCAGDCINDADNDGICNENEVLGCMDPSACNYNALATDEDNSCVYPAESYLNCDGSCINDSDNDGVCNELEQLGCTDPTACNFNSNATDENGSCSYADLVYFTDNDGDGEGFGDAQLFCSNPGFGYVSNDTDCNDSNASINSQSPEICDEIDNDCDGEIDEFVTSTYYLDSDGDGFGNVNETVEACELPGGYSENSDDCDDDLLTFEDFDEDGFGTDVIVPCGASNELDCNDANPTVHAGAIDICGNGIDEDCSNGDSVCVVLGCMDVTACNFNPSANEDDASCTYPTQSYLNCDGSCINDTDNDGVCNENEISGCTDPEACNYNAAATDDNATCIYPAQTYLNCDGSCINDSDNDGICNENEVSGCTDPEACNYNAAATDDDASCTYPAQTYLNCDGSCINDSDNDGICNENEVSGCTDPTACNYNENVTDDDASCTYPAQTYLNCDGSCINDSDNDGICNENEVPGCTDPEACNYNAAATDDDASCTYPAQTYLNCDGSCINDIDNDGVCNENEISGCTDPEACNYNAAATDDDASCTYPAQSYLNCDGSCVNDSDNDGICNENEVVGCTDPNACNYNENATDDDASCTYPAQSYLKCDGSCINDTDDDGVCDEIEVLGCTHSDACNFNADATEEDESCTYPTQSYLNCDGSCINDTDNDGVCDENEYIGCTDPSACNYNPEATNDNGSCIYPAQAYLNCDGVCINDEDADGICTEVEGTDDIDNDGTPNNLDVDSDGDGIDDAVEGVLDADNDGHPNFLDLDSDGDGISDDIELVADMDEDGVPNYLDLDSDGDDIEDSIELTDDVDGDGSPNFLDLDSDGDGILDDTEDNVDTDGDGTPNYLDLDSDDDGISDSVELTDDMDGDDTPNYLDVDSDGDGILDETELTNDMDGDNQPNYLDVDSDGDGILDEVEGNVDSDGDGTPNYLDLDSDGDGILDEQEGEVDSDGDGTPNYLDLDSDGDGIMDETELTADLDEDGVPNYLDLDSDGDDIEDSIELTDDVDGDGSPNFLDLDSDGDGILDDTEDNVDTDGDGTPNYLDLDSDDDGISDSVELTDDMDGDDTPNYLDVDSDGDGILDETELTNDMDGDNQPNYLDVDSDGDGILDEVEGNVDSDGDGTPNYLDLDSDGDGIPDETEGTVDSDGDGTPDYLDLDSDGDGVLDETEGSTDTDGDGLPNYLDVDSDNDGVHDGNEVLGCTDALACDFNPLATDSSTCSYNAEDLLVGETQNASCSSGLGSAQVLNFENFTTYYLVEQDQEINATAIINGLSDGQYWIVGKRTETCISDTVTFVVGYNADCAPNAVNDTLLINEDAGLMQLNLVFNDSDLDNNLDVSTIDLDPTVPGAQTSSTGPEGDWSVDGNGILNFTPALNYNGVTTRLYVVADASGLTSNTAEIFIQVSPVNDAPIVVPSSLEVSVDLNSTTTICLDATDIDGDAVNVSSWILMEGLGTINDNAADDYCFDFTASGWQIPTSIMVVMCDDGSPSLCDTAWVTINVNPLNPIAVDDYITSNDGLVNIDVVLNDTLYGDSNFTVTIIDSTDFGRVDLDTSLISYQPDWSYCGLDSMTYSVCNSFGMCDTATVYFEVTPIDSDLDGIPDYIETVTADIDGDGIFNHLDEDSDGDGLLDAEESGMTDLCSPTLSDCNENGIPDYLDFNNCIPDLEIPEGFSPNGDGVNDTWVIPGIENYPGNTMVVFNRWGNQVYSAEPYDNSWNGECNESGTIGGNTLPEGTYFFIFKSERNATAKQGYIYIKR